MKICWFTVSISDKKKQTCQMFKDYGWNYQVSHKRLKSYKIGLVVLLNFFLHHSGWV